MTLEYILECVGLFLLGAFAVTLITIAILVFCKGDEFQIKDEDDDDEDARHKNLQ